MLCLRRMLQGLARAVGGCLWFLGPVVIISGNVLHSPSHPQQLKRFQVTRQDAETVNPYFAHPAGKGFLRRNIFAAACLVSFAWFHSAILPVASQRRYRPFRLGFTGGNESWA